MTRLQEAMLLCIVLRGGIATQEEIFEDLTLLGIEQMTDAEYTAWKAAIQPGLERVFRERDEAMIRGNVK
jgi:hypothetical protein